MQINGPKIYFTIPIFGGIPVTQTLVTSLIVTVILCVAGVLLGRKLQKRPGRAQVLTEKAVTVITNMVKEAMGEHNARWTPFIAAIFLSSLLGTLLGMTGILRSSTADISTTMTWAVLVSLICWYEAIKHNGFLGWLKGFTEPIAVMTPMNIVSEIAQPVSLAFRHFGNIAGGGVITALIYWALSGASAGVLRLIASSTVAVPLVLLAAGAGLVLLSGKRKNGKRRKLPLLLGIVCLALSGLRLADWLWSLTGRAYPRMNGLVTGLAWFAGLAVLLAGIVLLVGHKKRSRLILGILLAALGFLAICFVSEGPMGVPVLTLGIPAVLSLYFDVFSGVIQAFVFSLLTMIYISSNCPAPEEKPTNE
ncbi:MAG: F0F1 ATP synthase subunit A [Oscillospiraceae bacterium]|nr:F0F1 ATP synthase subunit A [Oscillospiraceae bacterium]